MNLRPRSSFNTYFPPTTMTYRKLPTNLDIYMHCISLKPCCDALAKSQTTIRILDIWHRASLHTFSKAYVTAKLSTYISIVIKLKKSQNNSKFYTYFQTHKEKYDKLFDICPCKCKDQCRCLRLKHVPPYEKYFLDDQRITRLRCIDLSTRIDTSKQSRSLNNKNSGCSHSRYVYSTIYRKLLPLLVISYGN